MSLSELKQLGIDSQNERSGNLTGYDCPKCKNRGYIYYLDDNDMECCRECECMQIRRVKARARNCGLGEALNKYTFKNFKCDESWQKDLFTKAQKFVVDTNAKCFFVGGQSGSGKSHICTAIVGKLLRQGYDAQFIVWNDAVTTLKQRTYDDANSYNSYLERLKTVDVLYIDDFFKTMPTTADIDKAFQIINYRYNTSNAINGKRYVTIISSERVIANLTRVDAAIAGRIYELATPEYITEIASDKQKNMRCAGRKGIII